jgi:hypothetical protein
MLGRADARGVVRDVLHFGEPIVELQHGRTAGHDSTRGVVYRHQARHVAVVADSADVMWGPGMQQLVGELSAPPAGGKRALASRSRDGRSA